MCQLSEWRFRISLSKQSKNKKELPEINLSFKKANTGQNALF